MLLTLEEPKTAALPAEISPLFRRMYPRSVVHGLRGRVAHPTVYMEAVDILNVAGRRPANGADMDMRPDSIPSGQ